MSNTGILDYTKLDTLGIKTDIEKRMFENEFIQNFPDSSLGKMLLNNIASIIDIANFNIEQVSKEMLIDYAKNFSSIVGKTNNMFYSIKRKKPSEVETQISFQCPSNAIIGDVIIIPRFTKFQIGAYQYLTQYTLNRKVIASDIGNTLQFDQVSITETSDGYSLLTSNEISYRKSIGENILTKSIVLMQGEIKEVVVPYLSSANDGSLSYQRYVIPDADFSDYFGQNDLSYNKVTGQFNPMSGLCVVGIGTDFATAFSKDSIQVVDRYSFYTATNDAYKTIGNDKRKNCVIRTDASGGVEIIFGEQSNFRVPSMGEVIGIRYLRTSGASANSYSIRGTIAKSTSSAFIASSSDSLNDIKMECKCLSHSIGGTNIESIESIKNNLSSFYNSKDRLVTRNDYIGFLNGVEYPIKSKTSCVFGEQEYNKLSGVNTSKFLNPLRNSVAFSLMGDLYSDTNAFTMYPLTFEGGGKTLYSSLIDGTDYDEWSKVAYYYILSRREMINYRNLWEIRRFTGFSLADTNLQMTPFGFENVAIVDRDYPYFHPVKQFYDILGQRSMLNINHIYIPPVIQQFTLEGEVIVSDFSDAMETERDVNNKIYTFLNDNTKFGTPIFKSQIDEVINAIPSVNYSNIEIVPKSDWNYSQNGAYFSEIENEFKCRTYLENIGNTQLKDMYFVRSDNPCIVRDYGKVANQIKSQIIVAENMNVFGIGMRNGMKGNSTQTIVTLLKPNSSGEIVQGINVSLGALKIREKLLNKLVRVNGTSVYRPTPIKPAIGGIVDITPIKIKIGNGATRQDIIDILGVTPTNIDAPNAQFEMHDLYLLVITFTKDEWSYLFDSDEVLLAGKTTNISPQNLNNFKISEMKYVDESNLSIDNICSFYMGFCPQQYIVDAIQRSLKSIYAELGGVVICADCGVTSRYETTSSVITNSETTLCSDCRCNYDSHFVGTNVSNGNLEVLNDGTAETAWSYVSYEQNKISNTNNVLNSINSVAGTMDIQEYFNVIIPKQVLTCWDGEMSLEKKIHQRIKIDERWFYEVLIKRIVNELRFSAMVTSQNDNTTINDFRAGMIDTLINFFNANQSDIEDSIVPTLADTTTTSRLGTTFASTFKDLYQMQVNGANASQPQNVEDFLNSKTFINIITKLHNAFSTAIRSGMLDKYGNVMNYSLPNEIVQVKSNLIFRKRI